MSEKPVWHIAVKNTLTSKDKWHYVLLYDFDDIKLTELDTRWIKEMMDGWNQSFILRKSLHGYHLVGLSPNDSFSWGAMFKELQIKFPTYHDGQAIRIDPKEVGEFIILQESFKYPFSVNLAKLVLPKIHPSLDVKNNPLAINQMWYVLLYYTTNKNNIKNKEVIRTSG